MSGADGDGERERLGKTAHTEFYAPWDRPGQKSDPDTSWVYLRRAHPDQAERFCRTAAAVAAEVRAAYAPLVDAAGRVRDRIRTASTSGVWSMEPGASDALADALDALGAADGEDG